MEWVSKKLNIIIIIIIIIPFSLKANTAEMIHYYNYTKWKSLTTNASVRSIVTTFSYHIYAFLENGPSSAERCRKYLGENIILSMFSEHLMVLIWYCLLWAMNISKVEMGIPKTCNIISINHILYN